MLRVSVHAGHPSGVSRYNRSDWLDIGYERLDADAVYKIVLFQAGIGACEAVLLKGYPRWSGSLWDLVARSIAMALWPEETGQQERVEPAQYAEGQRIAFAKHTTAIVTHLPEQGTASREIATMLIAHSPKALGVYRASVDEDTRDRQSVSPFLFAPAVLSPIELVLRTALFMLHGSIDTLPARPPLVLPPRDEEADKKYVRLSRVTEPARTGLTRWLLKVGRTPEVRSDCPAGRVPEAWYEEFLRTAI